MAKDTLVKKRKASAPDASLEKVKKVKSAAVVPEAQIKKRKAIEDVAAPAVKKSKSQAAPNSKAPKKTNDEPIVEDKPPATISKLASKKTKTTKAQNEKPKETIPSDFESDEDEVEEAGADESESEVDDQTEALLKGFESDGDDQEDNGRGLEEGQSVPKVPKLSKAEQKLLKSKSEDADEKPGVVYVGRIPHGFYEYEMKEYFKQFGDILKLRLSRNRKTGASRHYAFIQFESATVADIVARTMDNYLLFGHILKVKTLSDEQLSPDLWKGANKRFKKVPWNKLEGRQLKQGASEEVWNKRVEKEKQRRAQKQKVLAGMDYEFEQPALKSAKGVAAKAALTNGDEGGEAGVKSILAVEHEEEKSTKNEKGVVQITTTDNETVESSGSKRTKKQASEATVKETPAIPEKQLKAKKSKTSLIETTTQAATVKSKKTKKSQK